MKVRTRLFLLSAIFVILIVTLGFTMLYTSDLTNREVRESDAASMIIKDIFELNIVTYEYMTHHEERMHQQWLLKYDSLGKLLEETIKEEIHPEHLSGLESISSDYESLGDFFSQLQANFAKRQRLIEENRPQAEIDLSLASEERLSRQALMRSRSITSEAFRLSAVVQQRIARVQQRTNSIVLFSIIGFAIVSFCISFLTTRAITGPLNELVKGAKIIGKGNLNHRVDIKTGNEIGELAAAFDQMTEKRQRAEETLRESEERFRTIVETAPSLLLITDAEGNNLYVSPNCEEITGYTQEELLGRVVFWAHEDDTLRAREVVDRTFREGVGCKDLEYKAVKKNGELWDASSSWEPIKDAEGKLEGVVFQTVDITERKRAEEELSKHREHLEEMVEQRTAELAIAKGRAEEADRLKSVFLATMSHELRTPLNSIIGFTGIMLQGLPGELNQEQKKQLSMAYGSAKHLLALINDILDISKIEAGQIELAPGEFDVSALIQEVVKTLTPMAETKGLEMIVSISPQVGEIYSDRRRVEQILLNLVNNAFKFTDQGEVRIEAQIVDGHLQVSVQDTGIGIKEDSMGSLFQPFRQIGNSRQRRYEGTGLGLNICKRLVDLMGGQIWAESEYGVGSRFTFTLPLTSEQQEA